MATNDMRTLFVDYIENNKEKYNISTYESLDFLQEVLNEVKKEYSESDNA